MNIRDLCVAFSSLPGEKAHSIMAPRPKIVDGLEGCHDCPPVRCAVLIILIQQGNDWVIPFIYRTNRGKHHAGQIAFPGGKVELTDEDLKSAALRETREEIGVPPDNIEIIGKLSDVYIPLSNFYIAPYVGTMNEIPIFVPSEGEVERVITLSLYDLIDDRNKTVRSFYRLEHEIKAPGYLIGEHFIWGATAMMISELEYMVKQLE